MRKIGRAFWAGVSLFLLATAVSSRAQTGSPNPAQDQTPPASLSQPPPPPPSQPPPTSPPHATSESGPDHSGAYYHFMLARRYQELAGIYNRSDFVDRAISEYKQAIEA